MSLYPDELGAATIGFPLMELIPDQLDQILILDRLATSHPAIAFPFDRPLGNALDCVLAVSADLDVLGKINSLEGAQDSCELGPLICLFLAF